MKKIAIIMGSDSDWPVVQKAADTLKDFGVPFEAHVYSAHRTPAEAREFALSARENGFGAIIAAAGMAAHLAGALAAATTLPVVGIPIKSSQLGGMDALLSTAQMPSGIPVATVAIDGAVNAALLCEGANMPLTIEAEHLLQNAGVPVGPAKAANAGGVSTSALEMSQNSMRLFWTFEEVDEKLHEIMQGIYKSVYEASVAAGHPGDLICGANVASFLKASKAMLCQGIF